MFVPGRQPGLHLSWPDLIRPSWYGLAERDYLEFVDLFGDRAGDELRGDRRAVEVQYLGQPRRIDLQFVHQQRAQLAVAVLLDHEHLVVLGDELPHVIVEREATHAQQIEMDTVFREPLLRLVHGRAGRAEL